ncbi:hypothetical protein OnM2_093035 [Erysiphe neolycopersici]|uniref:Uncharacterized protein n=1 Tax=Erysiphe neolycopersici TaxID=212602 RepID=A0A420HC60_9PEZI|nr:hypothetical protein OnM2_093035 [Erysiphe neolycopersici]
MDGLFTPDQFFHDSMSEGFSMEQSDYWQPKCDFSIVQADEARSQLDAAIGQEYKV